MSLDGVNLKIIALLQGSSQTTNKAIAQALNIAESTVAARIASMHETGALRVKLQWNAPVLGLGYMGLLMIDPGGNNIEALCQTLVDRDEVIALLSIAGDTAIMAVVLVSGATAFAEFTESVVARVTDLRSVVSEQVITVVKMQLDWGVHTDNHAQIPNLDCLLDADAIDGFDIDMLTLLKGDARLSNRQVAKQLGVSETKVRQRMTKVKSMGLVRVSAIVDPMFVKDNITAVVGILAAPAAVEAVCLALYDEENFPAILKVTGRYNIRAITIGGNFHTLFAAVRQKICGIEGVQSVGIFPVMETHKHLSEISWFV